MEPQLEQSHTPWPLKAYNNPSFLNSAAAREIRILCELTEPKARYAAEGIENTIIFFGSARIPDETRGREAVDAARLRLEKTPADPAAQRQLKRAQRLAAAAPFHEMARDLAQRLASWASAIDDPAKRLYICTGGGPGMMEAANEGAHRAGAKSVGLGISLPFEPESNPWIPDSLRFDFHYFMIRKYWFALTARAMVVCPGGFGTMDEFFEMLTLMQTRKTAHYLPTVLIGRPFWEDVLHFEKFLDWGVINESDLGLFRICDSVDEAFDWIVAELDRCFLNPVGTMGTLDADDASLGT